MLIDGLRTSGASDPDIAEVFRVHGLATTHDRPTQWRPFGGNCYRKLLQALSLPLQDSIANALVGERASIVFVCFEAATLTLSTVHSPSLQSSPKNARQERANCNKNFRTQSRGGILSPMHSSPSSAIWHG